MHRIIFCLICLLALLGVFGPPDAVKGQETQVNQTVRVERPVQTVAAPFEK